MRSHTLPENLKMTLENPALLELYKQKDSRSQMLSKAKYGLLAAGLGSMAVFGPSATSVFVCGTALGLLTMDRSITHFYKQHSINREVEQHMMNLDIQR